MPSTLDWLRSRDDHELVALLRARPDLTVPAPSDLTVLAGRLNTGPSVWRAMESLNAFHIQVLQALAVLDAEKRAVPRSVLAGFLGPEVPADAVAAALERLESLALVRGQDPVAMPSAVLSVLGGLPAGLAAPGSMTVEQAAAALADLDPAARGIVDRLATGVPRGTTDPRSSVGRAVAALVRAGLLRRIDVDTVELPREVALAARGSAPLGPIRVHPPTDGITDHGTATLDGTAAGQALAAVDRVRRLLDLIGQNPPPALRSGGLGIRELRRLAKAGGADERTTALDVELLAGMDLIATEHPRDRVTESWTPTEEADAFLDLPDEAAWADLAATWLDLRRNPARAGTKDAADKIRNALSPELSWIRGPVDRRFVLTMLAELAPGQGLSAAGLDDRIAWRSPLRPPDHRRAVLDATVTEATALGVVAFGGLSSAGRALLADPAAAREAARAALTAALPAPVDTVMVQADLTVVAPGRLVPELAARLAQAADLESSGSASVYRVTPQSVRRALDLGVSTAELHALFREHSMTGVPQALEYLIDDVGRRYGSLRLGQASTYLRSDDPTLIDQAIVQAASLGLDVRRLAPTVAVSTAALPDLMTNLRAGGLVPAAEDGYGALLDLRSRPPRARPRSPQQHWREPPTATVDQLGALVERMRSVDRAAPAVQRGDAPIGDLLEQLRSAARDRRPTWIGYADAQGVSARRLVEPVTVTPGKLVAFDRSRGEVRNFPLHRITSVAAAEPDDPADAPSPEPAPPVR
ncbi:helicase C-terminal domain-containing protein [Nakamurella sp.]|uniref:helicase C-terminal domain-containing protein n=1 Tax=Nakamurella sp. TaxID=1869182 RepID=UPI003B3ABBF7